jgi:predicted anti-sigma-YlaC factor YlaD
MTAPAHLTDDQFTQCVIAAPTAESAAHLLDCAQCRKELSRFTTSVSDFSRVTLAWSESRPSVSLRGASLSRMSHPIFAHARWALAAVLVLAAGVPVLLRGNHQVAVPADVAVVAAPVPDDSQEQIAQDNKLMQSVSLAIGVGEPSPFREYGLQESRPAKPSSGSRSE